MSTDIHAYQAIYYLGEDTPFMHHSLEIRDDANEEVYYTPIENYDAFADQCGKHQIEVIEIQHEINGSRQPPVLVSRRTFHDMCRTLGYAQLPLRATIHQYMHDPSEAHAGEVMSRLIALESTDPSRAAAVRTLLDPVHRPTLQALAVLETHDLIRLC